MDTVFNNYLIFTIRNISSFIRWHFLERINPLKNKKILVVGLSKTGTTSLHGAFNVLGIESIHYPQYYQLVGHELEFKWHWRFDKSRAFSDIPVIAFLDELLKKYPESCVIYTSREKTTWLESCRKHFELPAINPKGNALRLKVYGCPVFDFEKFSNVYDEHDQMIRERFKDHSRFIEIKLEQKDKWSELCKFLGVSIPSVNYPHANKYQTKSIR